MRVNLEEDLVSIGEPFSRHAKKARGITNMIFFYDVFKRLLTTSAGLLINLSLTTSLLWRMIRLLVLMEFHLVPANVPGILVRNSSLMLTELFWKEVPFMIILLKVELFLSPRPLTFMTLEGLFDHLMHFAALSPRRVCSTRLRCPSDWLCRCISQCQSLLDRCRTWPLNGSRRFRAKQKLLGKPREACKSSWSPIGILKSFTLTIPWNSAKLVKISPGIITRLHHTDRRLMGLLKEQSAEQRKAPLPYCCNQVWMKIVRQILWNVTLICETSQIYYLMGRRPLKDVFGNHVKDRSFRSVHWLSITLSLQKTSQESISLER